MHLSRPTRALATEGVFHGVLRLYVPQPAATETGKRKSAHEGNLQPFHDGAGKSLQRVTRCQLLRHHSTHITKIPKHNNPTNDQPYGKDTDKPIRNPTAEAIAAIGAKVGKTTGMGVQLQRLVFLLPILQATHRHDTNAIRKEWHGTIIPQKAQFQLLCRLSTLLKAHNRCSSREY